MARKFLRKRDFELLYKLRFGQECLDKSRHLGYTINDYYDSNEVYDILSENENLSQEEFDTIFGRLKTDAERRVCIRFNRFI